MLHWLDGRNSSFFTSLSWKGRTLSFRIVPRTGAIGLQAMLPTDVGTSSMLGVTRNGGSVQCTARTVKGIRYAFFPAVSGVYEATYSAPHGP